MKKRADSGHSEFVWAMCLRSVCEASVELASTWLLWYLTQERGQLSTHRTTETPPLGCIRSVPTETKVRSPFVLIDRPLCSAQVCIFTWGVRSASYPYGIMRRATKLFVTERDFRVNAMEPQNLALPSANAWSYYWLVALGSNETQSLPESLPSSSSSPRVILFWLLWYLWTQLLSHISHLHQEFLPLSMEYWMCQHNITVLQMYKTIFPNEWSL